MPNEAEIIPETPADNLPQLFPEDEMNPALQDETIFPADNNVSIQNMDVHHHPDLHHKTKKWKEYFLEFLMIFLAVSLGFIAENLREQIKEKKEIKRYMQSMVSDLKSDIAMYDSSIHINVKNCLIIDTLVNLLHTGKQTGKAYLMARMLTIGQGIFTPDTKTFELLKSTGGMRLIDDVESLDSINAYYQLLKYFEYWSALQRQRLNEVIEGNDKLFDATVFLAIYKGVENPEAQVFREDSNPPLLSRDPILTNSVIMHFQYLYGISKILDRKATEAEMKATRLADILNTRFK